MIAARKSTAPPGEPGVLMTRQRPTTPASARDSRPLGPDRRIASASPGARRSMIPNVASGVTSRGANPVPPVVTITPVKCSLMARSAAVTGSTPSGETARSTTSKPAELRQSTSAVPERSSARWLATESETVSTFASSRTIAERKRATRANGHSCRRAEGKCYRFLTRGSARLSAADHRHGSNRAKEPGVVDPVPGKLSPDRAPNHESDLLIARAGAHQVTDRRFVV